MDGEKKRKKSFTVNYQNRRGGHNAGCQISAWRWKGKKGKRRGLTAVCGGGGARRVK